MKRNYTKESWQKVLDTQKRAAATHTLKAKNRRKEYLKNPIRCKQCEKIIPFERRLKYNSFCNNSCSALYNNPNRKKKWLCIECGKELRKNSKKYCSPECQTNYQYKDYINKWLSGEISGNAKQVPVYIRKWLLEQNGEQCWICGWKEINLTTNKIPLQVHHIDGHCLNNRPENIELLCPNHHSLTPTFGGLNKGSDRIWRYKK
jgi:hypothetical protein